MYSILRTYHPEATISVLNDEQGNYICNLLGRPWLNNQPNTLVLPANNSSCIPEGIYTVQKYMSPTKGKVFLVKNVNNRSYIEWHSANNTLQLLGCEAPCDKILENITDVEGVTHRYWGNNSRNTLEMLLEKLPDIFMVEIKSA